MKDPQGRWLTRALFEELTTPEMAKKYPPIMSLEKARLIYLSAADPTEYKAAIRIVGNWDHWLALQQSPLFMEHLNKWREELAVKLMSHGIENIIDLASGEKGFQAAKWLAERGWSPKKTKKEKAEVKETQTNYLSKKELEDDAKRVSLLN